MHLIQSTTPERLLPLKAVMNMTGMSRSWIYEHMELGDFPQSVRIGNSNSVRWQESLVQAWIRAQIDGSPS